MSPVKDSLGLTRARHLQHYMNSSRPYTDREILKGAMNRIVLGAPHDNAAITLYRVLPSARFIPAGTSDRLTSTVYSSTMNDRLLSWILVWSQHEFHFFEHMGETPVLLRLDVAPDVPRLYIPVHQNEKLPWDRPQYRQCEVILPCDCIYSEVSRKMTTVEMLPNADNHVNHSFYPSFERHYVRHAGPVDLTTRKRSYASSEVQYLMCHIKVTRPLVQTTRSRLLLAPSDH